MCVSPFLISGLVQWVKMRDEDLLRAGAVAGIPERINAQITDVKVTKIFFYFFSMFYNSGAPLIRTPLGRKKSVLFREVSSFQGSLIEGLPTVHIPHLLNVRILFAMYVCCTLGATGRSGSSEE